jgi:two-component system, chemotaxis family, protein-glutamate methylesterase/glutaminase
MTEPKVRVLVIDDSAFARKVLREILSASGEIEFVGIARDGLDGLERIAALKPDVVTLDLVMPDLDGLGVLRALQNQAEPPAVVVVSLTDEDSELGISALQLGAFDLVHKPTALALDRLYELGDDLLKTVIAAGRSERRRSKLPAVRPLPLPPRSTGTLRTQMVVVGASTGGPQALTTIIGALPRDFPVPVAVVLHMPTGYTEAFARRLDKDSVVEVVEAREGLIFRPGQVVIARAGSHLSIEKDPSGWRAVVDIHPLGTLHRPSVDVLFASAAKEFGPSALGVVLTGMGNDGLAGSEAIYAAGGRLLTETEESCVVYGMPRCVFQANLAIAEAPVAAMVGLIMNSL